MIRRLTELDGLAIDVEALRRNYAEERDRRLRPDGIAQYVEVVGRFAGFAEDPWAQPHFTREPLRDEVDVAIVGAGFGGLLTGARLREHGVETVVKRSAATAECAKSCTPGYYNREGKADAKTRQGSFVFGEPTEYAAILESWRAQGELDGSVLHSPEAAQ